jgi:hypothetical protein
VLQALKPARSQKNPVQRIASIVQSMILVRELLSSLPALAEALDGGNSNILKAVRICMVQSM